MSLIYRAKPPPFRWIFIHVLFIKSIKQGLTTVKGIWEQYLSSYSTCWVASGDLIFFPASASPDVPTAFPHFLCSSLICTLLDLFVSFQSVKPLGVVNHSLIIWIVESTLYQTKHTKTMGHPEFKHAIAQAVILSKVKSLGQMGGTKEMKFLATLLVVILVLAGLSCILPN